MRPLSLLIFGITLLQPCLGELDPVDAALTIYAYFVYDLDAAVWGPGNGQVATKCHGARESGICTFDEFVNYLATGKAADTPKYYDSSAGFSFFPADVVNMVEAIRYVNGLQNPWGKVIVGRKTKIGLLRDLGAIILLNGNRADVMKISIRRQMENVARSLESLQVHITAKSEDSFVERMRSLKTDVVLKYTERKNQYYRYTWKKADWTATVEANPQLLNKDSLLYKNTVTSLKGDAHLLQGTREEKAMALYVADTVQKCLRRS